MRRTVLSVFIIVAGSIVFLFWLAFLSARPPNSTETLTLQGDGSALNYCELPALDGSGKSSAEIPKANTPGCSYKHFPLPILRECTEPLATGADDIRGLWRVVEGERIGHVERVEQCGSRVVVTSSGIIHDYGPNSTAGPNTNDTEGAVLFTIRDAEYCMRTSASMLWEGGVLNFYAFGWGPRVVQRYRDGERLIWEYADGSTNSMERICTLPEEHRVPYPRGRRIKLL